MIPFIFFSIDQRMKHLQLFQTTDGCLVTQVFMVDHLRMIQVYLSNLQQTTTTGPLNSLLKAECPLNPMSNKIIFVSIYRDD